MLLENTHAGNKQICFGYHSYKVPNGPCTEILMFFIKLHELQNIEWLNVIKSISKIFH